MVVNLNIKENGMEEEQTRLQLYQPLRDAYCEHILAELSKRNKIMLLTKSYEPYYFDNYKLIKLNSDEALLEYLDNNCGGQAQRYEEIVVDPELILSCSLGTIDVELMEGLEKDWYNFIINYLKNEASSEIVADLAFEYAIQYEQDGFTDKVYKKFMRMLPAFLDNAEDKEEYWNMQDVLIEVENDYQLSGIGDAVKLIKQEIAWIWNSQYVSRGKKLLKERSTKYEETFRQQLDYLPVAKRKISRQLEGYGRLNKALFNLSILTCLTKNLNEYEMDKNDKLLQALQEKYNFNDIDDLKHDFLQYLLENFAEYVTVAAIIPPEPHKYRAYLCNFHNKNRRDPFYQSAIEYYSYHRKEIDQCHECKIVHQLHYYSSYYIEVQLKHHKYAFHVSYPLGKSWLPNLTQFPKVENDCQQRLLLEQKANEEELLWAYDNDLLVEVAEFMNT